MLFTNENNIKMLAMDCDGVLTDGKIHMNSNGEDFKSFHVGDGMGFFLARRAGLKLAIITGRSSVALSIRAKELGVEDLHQNISDKAAVLKELMVKYNLKSKEIAYIGDDINDIPAFEQVGLKIAVSNADDFLKKMADLVTDKCGGNGAVREVINHILKKQGLLEKIINQTYSGE